MLTNVIVLANSMRDTLKPLGPSQIVYVTLTTIYDVVLNWSRGASSYCTRGKALMIHQYFFGLVLGLEISWQKINDTAKDRHF